LIIDAHAHTAAPLSLAAYKAALLSHRGAHGRGKVRYTDEQLEQAWHRKEMAPTGHMEHMDYCGIDVQLISPRPFQAMHSEQPGYLVDWYTHEVNRIIHDSARLFPDRIIGVGGLPQQAGEPVDVVFDEMELCVKEYGFRGFLLNPDPFENDGTMAPALGDRYWYPLYEKACELDVPLQIHTAGSRRPQKEPYSMYFVNAETTAVYGLVTSSVFDDFPELKVICSHGGGAIPYQLGRFNAGTAPRDDMDNDQIELFEDRLRKMYFDTVLYSKEALELLIRVVGPDNLLFGSECPGVGSAIDRRTGETYDRIAPVIQAFDWLSEADKAKIFSENARRLYKLDATITSG
jgi:predicted TIM-barrel fold metal-dependent hydrolase